MAGKLFNFENAHRFHEFDIINNQAIGVIGDVEAVYTVREIDRRAMAQASKYGTLQLVFYTPDVAAPDYKVKGLFVKRITDFPIFSIPFTLLEVKAPFPLEAARTILEPILNATEMKLESEAGTFQGELIARVVCTW